MKGWITSLKMTEPTPSFSSAQTPPNWLLNSYIASDKSCAQFVVQGFSRDGTPSKITLEPITPRHIAAGRQILKAAGLPPEDYQLIEVRSSPPIHGGWGVSPYEIQYSFELKSKDGKK